MTLPDIPDNNTSYSEALTPLTSVVMEVALNLPSHFLIIKNWTPGAKSAPPQRFSPGFFSPTFPKSQFHIYTCVPGYIYPLTHSAPPLPFSYSEYLNPGAKCVTKSLLRCGFRPLLKVNLEIFPGLFLDNFRISHPPPRPHNFFL